VETVKRSILILLTLALFQNALWAADTVEPEAPPQETPQATFSLADGMGEAMRQEISRVGEEFQQQAVSLFERTPLGWDESTLVSLYRFALSLPMKLPVLVDHILDQGRALGAVGSILVFIFICAVFYAFVGQKRVMKRVEKVVHPLGRFMPNEAFPYFLSALKIVVASLIPLLLLGAYSLINAFIHYSAVWFLLTGRLLGVWVLGALILNLLHEILKSGLYPAADQYGKLLYRRARLVVFYILGGTAIVWGAESFALQGDIIAFLKFVITLSVVCVLLLLFFNRKAILSLLPVLPYQNYQTFRLYLERYYLVVVYGTFLTGVLWCFGYKRFSEVLWTKTWAVAAVYVGFLVLFHLIQGRLARWSGRIAATGDEDALIFSKTLQRLLLYVSVICAAVIISNLLGLSNPIIRMFSFPILQVGDKMLTLWLLIKAGIVFAILIYISTLLRTYLSFKVYPNIGVDTGLAYALNTFLKYVFFAIAFIATLHAVGVSPEILMIFAGAAGIGIGLGLQGIAANLISGLTIVFGRRVRKGDWVLVADTMGVVTDIFLHSTKVQTRDNVEYLIPNSKILSDIIVNYTLSSPTIRLSVPMGVSYNADPLEAEKIFLEAANKHPELSRNKEPEVRFVGFGDNSIDFEVLVWIDIRNTARRKARSLLYFTAFELLQKAGIEIPYPQRDIHIRSGLIGETA
jgi:small-conductance mechanosensitive channel